ncbi:MAG: LysE family translocator [Inquilinus sp.]|nr:LysE family translocator [Inquilinus sp.]
MFDPSTLALFLVAVTVLMVTPGPDLLFITANGIAQGPRAGAVSALGVGAGAIVHTFAAALGISALVLASPVAFDLVRYAGAAYLVWLGIQAIRDPAMLDLRVAAARRRSLWAVFRGGLACNVLNPKVAVFFIAFLPQFADPAQGSLALQMVVLGLILTIVATGWNTAVGLSSGGIGRYLARRPRVARLQAWISGLIFIALAVRLVLVGQRA